MSEKRSSVGRGNNQLVKRRRSKRRRAIFALGIFFLMIGGGIIYGLQQGAVRISHIKVFGADQSLAEIARTAMRGNYFGIIPRDSTFFFPSSHIRADIIAAYPDVAAVSLFRNGLSGLSIRVDDRAPVAQWCGVTLGATTTPLDTTKCYFFDASGFIYATTSTAQPVNSFAVYEPIITSGEGSTSPEYPIGATLQNADKLPITFDFARQLAIFGSPVSLVVIHDGEVDMYLASGTRVTYMLGDENSVFAELMSARADFNLTDGSVLYLDLRFSGKIYLKKK